MRNNLGWVALAIPPLGGSIASYVKYVASMGAENDPGADALQQVLVVLFLAAGCAAFAFTKFGSDIVKWAVCFPLYLLYMFVVMVVIDIAINGLHLRLF